MPRADKLKNNFLLGEISPLSHGQLRSDQYEAGVEHLKNFFVLPQGGVIKRSGTRGVALSSTSVSSEAHLIPFVVSEDDSYVIEISPDIDWTLFKDHAVNGTLSSANFRAHIGQDTQYLQIGDTMMFKSNSYPVTLRRVSASTWSFGTFETINGIKAKGPFNSQNILDSGTYTAATITPSGTTGTITLTASGAGFFEDGWAGRQVLMQDSAGNYTRVEFGTYSTATLYTGCTVLGAAFASAVASSIWALGLLHNGTGSALSGGAGCKAIGIYQDRLALGGFDLAPNRIALSRPGVYNDFMHLEPDATEVDDDGILLDIADRRNNNILWLQGTANGLLFGTIGSEGVVEGSDDDSTLTPSNVSARIFSNYGSSAKRPAPLATGSDYLVPSGSQRALRKIGRNRQVGAFETTEISALHEHLLQHKVSHVQHQLEPYPRLWATVLRGSPEATLDYDDSFKTEMICALYDSKSGVFAPSRVELGGYGNAGGDSPLIRSVAVIPSPDGTRDEAWILAERYINGTTYKSIEYFTPEFEQDTPLESGVFLDASASTDSKEYILAVTQASPAVITFRASTTLFSNGNIVKIEDVTGMTELNGNTYTLANKSGNTFELQGVDSTGFNAFTYSSQGVGRLTTVSYTNATFANETWRYVADGIDMGDVTLDSNGTFTFDRATHVHSGYPYNADMKLLRPEAGSATGTAMGKTQRIHRVSLMLDKTVNLKIGKDFDNLYPVRAAAATDLFTGIVSVNSNIDYELGNRLCLRIDTPLPGTILAITQHLATQDR